MSRVILWTTPRCLSTAFELSIRELDEVKVKHEPNSLPFWCEKRNYGTTKTFEDARRDMLEMVAPNDRKKHLFIEETAYYIAGKYDEYVGGDFSCFKHTFLIRNPKSVGLSMQKVRMVYEEKSDESFYFPETLGFEELFGIYEKVKTIDPNPVIVTAEHLQTNPR